jgi:peptidase E
VIYVRGSTANMLALWRLHGVDAVLGRAWSECVVPHYDSEPDRRPTYQRAVGDGALAAGVAADDGVALHFGGTDLVEVVSERPGAAACRVERDGDGVRETRIEPTLLPVGP